MIAGVYDTETGLRKIGRVERDNTEVVLNRCRRKQQPRREGESFSLCLSNDPNPSDPTTPDLSARYGARITVARFQPSALLASSVASIQSKAPEWDLTPKKPLLVHWGKAVLCDPDVQ